MAQASIIFDFELIVIIIFLYIYGMDKVIADEQIEYFRAEKVSFYINR